MDNTKLYVTKKAIGKLKKVRKRSSKLFSLSYKITALISLIVTISLITPVTSNVCSNRVDLDKEISKWQKCITNGYVEDCFPLKQESIGHEAPYQKNSFEFSKIGSYYKNEVIFFLMKLVYKK